MKFFKKKFVLVYSLVGFLISYIASNPVEFGFCQQRYTFGDYVGCFDKLPESVAVIFFFFSLLVLPFSLITYRMKEEVFQRWIRFAIWYIPLLIIGYFIYPQGGGLMASSFDAFVFILFVSIFVITSIVKIVRAHKSSLQISHPRFVSLFHFLSISERHIPILFSHHHQLFRP